MIEKSSCSKNIQESSLEYVSDHFQESLLEREIAALKRELHGARGLAEAERQTVFLYFILCICVGVSCFFLFICQSSSEGVLLKLKGKH